MRDRSKYSTAWWQKLRAAVLAAEPLCRYCQERGRVTPATEVDHVVPLAKGGTDDWENLAATCRPCHERKTLNDIGARPRGVGVHGMPTDSRHWWRAQPQRAAPGRVVVVCGPPGAGKTTFVREHAKPGDLIIDHDALAVAISGLPAYQTPRSLVPAIMRARDALVESALRMTAGHAWIIDAAPGAAAREAWQRRGARVELLKPEPDECKRRLAADPARAPALDALLRAVDAWFTREAVLGGEDGQTQPEASRRLSPSDQNPRRPRQGVT